MVGWGRSLLPKILGQTDPVKTKWPSIFARSASAEHLAKRLIN